MDTAKREVIHPEQIDLLCATHLPGLGPVRLERAVQAFGSAREIFSASATQLATACGISPEQAANALAARGTARATADRELELAAAIGVRIVVKGQAEYPTLLAQVPSAPPLLYVRGELQPESGDRFAVAIVGSRDCSQYGREQADRFATQLAGARMTVVSGGARGIDGVAHAAAVRCGGRTIAVMGCGLKHIYPQEHAELFASIAAGHGAIVSELPLKTAPSAQNFPRRNRLISGISLGVLVIEAGLHSGSLITARIATEEHGREVYAVPGRVDSKASEGTLELLKLGGAALVTSPADVMSLIERPVEHIIAGTHRHRYQPMGDVKAAMQHAELPFSTGQSLPAMPETANTAAMNDEQRAIMQALGQQTLAADEIISMTGLDAAKVRSELTMLELRRLVARVGSRFAARS